MDQVDLTTIIKFYLLDQIEMIERKYAQKLPYVNHYKREPSDIWSIVLKAEIQDFWWYVRFSDGIHSYNIVKGGKEWHSWDEEPIMDNFDWGYVFRIWAIVNNKPFYEDIMRSEEDRKLYYLDGIKNELNNLLGFEWSAIYCGRNKRYVCINPVNCYTGIQYVSEQVFVFETHLGGNCYFV